jgi:hypothetical protein
MFTLSRTTRLVRHAIASATTQPITDQPRKKLITATLSCVGDFPCNRDDGRQEIKSYQDDAQEHAPGTG